MKFTAKANVRTCTQSRAYAHAQMIRSEAEQVHRRLEEDIAPNICRHTAVALGTSEFASARSMSHGSYNSQKLALLKKIASP